MASRVSLLQRLRSSPLSLLLHRSSPNPLSFPPLPLRCVRPCYKSSNPSGPFENSWVARNFSHDRVNLVLSEGTPKFETHEAELPKRGKWKTKKRLKLQRKREKQKRKDANKRDPRCIRHKGKKKKHKFPDAEARIKYKIEKAKIKEAILVERLKRYEVPQAQGPMIKPEILTGEERFYMKKMAQKSSNYVPVGRRGVFGGVILNMHLHWKKHETVKVFCKPCKPGQVHEYAGELARLSGGTPIQIIGDDTIIFYRGKNYVQPEVMSPTDTLSKKKALEKSKYEQSLDTVRRFIAISEKELELYYRHIALYGDPNTRNSDLVYGDQEKAPCVLGAGNSIEEETLHSISGSISTDASDAEVDSDGDELTGAKVDYDDEVLAGAEVDSDYEDLAGGEVESDDEDLTGAEVGSDDEDLNKVDSKDESNAPWYQPHEHEALKIVSVGKWIHQAHEALYQVNQ